MRKKTHEEFLKEVKAIVGNEYKVLGNYIHSRAKIKMEHKECKETIEITPDAFIRGNRCSHCKGNKISEKRAKTHEQFKQEFYNLVGAEYTILGEYRNSRTKINVKHNDCNHVYFVSPTAFLNGTRCPKCAKVSLANQLRKTHEQFVQEVNALVGSDYLILSEYKGSQVQVTMQHNKCGLVFEIKPNAFLNGARCYKCRL